MKIVISSIVKQYCYIILLSLIVSLRLFAVSDVPPAYQENIITPHWSWGEQHAEGTVNALFLVNNLALREPDELSERFDITAITIPTGGNPYKNEYDEDVLLNGLSNSCDVIVVASSFPWRDLSANAQMVLQHKVAAGTPMVCFGRSSNIIPPWIKNTKSLIVSPPLWDDIISLLPINLLSFRSSPEIKKYTFKKGKVYIISPYDQHCTFFTAFLPRQNSYFDDPVAPEIAYALAAKIIRNAAGKSADISIMDISIPADISVGRSLAITLSVGNKSNGSFSKQPLNFEWQLYTYYGELIQSGHIKLTGKKSLIKIIPNRGGKQICRWNLSFTDRTLDYGAFEINVKSPVSFTSIKVPDIISFSESLSVSWSIDRLNIKPLRVQCQVYDTDGRIVALQTLSADKKKMVISPWLAKSVSYSLRTLLLRNKTILDEKRTSINIRLDRKVDLQQYQTVLWATEKGRYPDQWRFSRLRDLGIRAMATLGCNSNAVRMASESGMRVVPTNVFVPVKGKEKERAEKLADFAPFISTYSPLGFSLADEPHGTNLVDWFNIGAGIIRKYDIGAKVGYCGTWSLDPIIYGLCNYITPYSPHHLYTPDLWLGVERDVYRSFKQKDGILTCWTHYAPWLDNEPYSRSVPWLWLFEEMNGVSYFQSAQNFAVLKSDLRTTHETRWWSEEVKEIQQGIGEQIIGMKRDAGDIRILYQLGSRDYADWVRVLNQASMPYKLITCEQLTDGMAENASLLICPDVNDVSDTTLTAMEKLSRQGTTVVATSCFGTINEKKIAKADRLDYLFGVIRKQFSGDVDEWKKIRDLYSGTPTEISLKSKLSKISYAGKSGGETFVKVNNAVVTGQYEILGEAKRNKIGDAPEFIKNIFDIPAIIKKRHGKVNAIYFTFRPDLKTISDIMLSLFKDADIEMPPEQVLVAGKHDNTIYQYPFSNGRIRLVGVIQDYWRVKPARQLSSETAKKTAEYFYHGPQQWDEKPAIFSLRIPAHIYNVRKGHYLGYGTKTEFKIQPGRPELFAFLPYKIIGLDISAPSEITAGGNLNMSLHLRADDGKPGRHVIHVSIVDPQGNRTINDQYNVCVSNGIKTLDVRIPYNAVSGKWTIAARDAITGVSAEKVFSVVPVLLSPIDVLPAKRVIVEKDNLLWPKGTWDIWSDNKNDTNIVTVSVSPVVRKHFKGKWNLSGGFTLGNSLESYTLKYLACNDPKETGSDDLGIIKAPYMPGFGFSKPRPNMWYYNGYLNVYLDDFRATVFAVTNISQVEYGDNGMVDIKWDTPVASFCLSSIMMPDHSGIFQELSVRAKKSFKKMTVKFSSYPAGFNNDPILKIVEQEHRSWVLLGSKTQDRAYGKGLGTGGLLILPEEWDTVKFWRPTTLTKKINNESDIKVHWTLWMFPEISNEKALIYMREHSLDTKNRLKKLYKQKQK